MNKLAICNRVIEHWMDNLNALYAGVLDEVCYERDDCDFCQEFNDGDDPPCVGCPLSQIQRGCHRQGTFNTFVDNVESMPYNADFDEFSSAYCKSIRSCESMIHILERACDHFLSSKYKEPK